jgi:c-di-GMP-binding flagellar brake protein YcgR
LTSFLPLHSILVAVAGQLASTDGDHLFPGEERRRYPRYGFQADIEIEFEGKAFRAFLTDISADGMFVVAANPLWVGAVFVARLHIADPLRVKCAVKRVLVGRGMGVEFRELTAQDRDSLDKILAGLAV